MILRVYSSKLSPVLWLILILWLPIFAIEGAFALDSTGQKGGGFILDRAPTSRNTSTLVHAQALERVSSVDRSPSYTQEKETTQALINDGLVVATSVGAPVIGSILTKKGIPWIVAARTGLKGALVFEMSYEIITLPIEYYKQLAIPLQQKQMRDQSEYVQRLWGKYASDPVLMRDARRILDEAVALANQVCLRHKLCNDNFQLNSKRVYFSYQYSYPYALQNKRDDIIEVSADYLLFQFAGLDPKVEIAKALLWKVMLPIYYQNLVKDVIYEMEKIKAGKLIAALKIPEDYHYDGDTAARVFVDWMLSEQSREPKTLQPFKDSNYKKAFVEFAKKTIDEDKYPAIDRQWKPSEVSIKRFEKRWGFDFIKDIYQTYLIKLQARPFSEWPTYLKIFEDDPISDYRPQAESRELYQTQLRKEFFSYRDIPIQWPDGKQDSIRVSCGAGGIETAFYHLPVCHSVAISDFTDPKLVDALAQYADFIRTKNIDRIDTTTKWIGEFLSAEVMTIVAYTIAYKLKVPSKTISKLLTPFKNHSLLKKVFIWTASGVLGYQIGKKTQQLIWPSEKIALKLEGELPQTEEAVRVLTEPLQQAAQAIENGQKVDVEELKRTLEENLYMKFNQRTNLKIIFLNN